MHQKPTETELEILGILWKQGPSTVRSVNEAMNEQKETGYTTTLKFLQIMHEKGLVGRDESRRSHVYHALITQGETQKALVDKMLETAFGGSAASLIMQALGNSSTTPEELRQIRAYLDQLEENQS